MTGNGSTERRVDELDDERLRRAIRSLGGKSEEGWEIDAEAVQRALAGEASREEVEALIDRLVDDPALAEAWELGLALRRELGGAEPVTGGAIGRWRRRALAAAAVVAASLGGALFWSYRPEAPPPAVRGEEQVIESLLPAGGALPREAFELRWSSSLDDPLFGVDVLGPDLELLHRADGLAAPSLRVPEEAFDGLGPGVEILWRVDAVDAAGLRSASPTFRQTLR